ncbi:MAG: DUF309 domain-containing protein [Thermoproteus sp. AZ2]|jgi:predicted metal-dependent hydrolase|uniref:DUF309 domain-containing protein n=1 Tax=Thermoproteus sp. AZ2 TaxID=1609232 RepID=A0ACC6UY98_9CREN|nr:MAG: hypothetical protein TU35_01470 [Thermoproteus sp. AZ2]
MARTLYIVENPGYTPDKREALLRELRRRIPALTVRVGAGHIEVVVASSDSPSVREALKAVGEVLEVIDITSEESVGRGDIRAFAEKFNSERFWEAHAEIEALWRRGRDPVLQALILAAAAFIKLQEGAPDKFVLLAQEALRLLERAPDRIDCVDLREFKASLERSIASRRPFKVICS